MSFGAATGSAMSLSESSIIEIFHRRFSGDRRGVVLGIGDDAAIMSLPEGCQLVAATDALVEGTHFLPGAPAASVGHRVLAVNLSDLAAMGADAHWATLSLSLPEADDAWVKQFADGFVRLAEEFNVALVGGDTVRGPLSAAVTVMGSVPSDQFVSRAGAREGDDIYLSGAPGCAAAGRGLLAGELRMAEWQADPSQVKASSSRPQAYRRSFEYPQPRLVFGAALRSIATAMIDVSDGVHIDLSRLLGASHVGARAVVPDLGALVADFGPELSRELFFCGGEDYELCFCAPAVSAAEVSRLAAQHAVPVTRIGEVINGAGLNWSQGGHPVKPAGAAFEHFEG